MAIADLIIQRISDAGYNVEVRPLENDAYQFVRATDPATGKFWVSSGLTLADAAAGLADLLKINLHDEPAPQNLERSFLPTLPLAVVIAITALIGAADLLLPGVNLSLLYLVPLAFLNPRRIREWMLLLIAIILLIYSVGLIEEIWISHHRQPEPAAFLNRGFAALAIVLWSAIGLYCRERPTQLLALQKGKTVAWIIAALLAATFILDLLTPLPANLTILYMVPLAFVGLTCRSATLWRIVALVCGLALLGYLLSRRSGITPPEVHLIIINRIVAMLGVVLAGWAFYLTLGRPAQPGVDSNIDSAASTSTFVSGSGRCLGNGLPL